MLLAALARRCAGTPGAQPCPALAATPVSTPLCPDDSPSPNSPSPSLPLFSSSAPQPTYCPRTPSPAPLRFSPVCLTPQWGTSALDIAGAVPIA